ncbi:hypothetical protein B0H14DRAFT_3167379 [Mycena olivaceomarginata]|nr:hypothetical protein B0H14DRAFT_3167379 [Mycena olivaceomarginata]
MSPTSLLSPMLPLRKSLPGSFLTVSWLGSTSAVVASQPLLRILLLLRVTRDVDCKTSWVITKSVQGVMTLTRWIKVLARPWDGLLSQPRDQPGYPNAARDYLPIASSCHDINRRLTVTSGAVSEVDESTLATTAISSNNPENLFHHTTNECVLLLCVISPSQTFSTGSFTTDFVSHMAEIMCYDALVLVPVLREPCVPQFKSIASSSYSIYGRCRWPWEPPCEAHKALELARGPEALVRPGEFQNP